MLLSGDPDSPIGRPGFDLSEDQLATVVDLVCRGAQEARGDVSPGMLEVPMTSLVRKAMRRVKARLRLTNLEIAGEHQLDDMLVTDPAVLGRIDMTLKFLHQFGDEDAYVAVECKRVGAGLHQLNQRYVSDGVARFASGQYAAGHRWGFMLGYVLVLPVNDPLRSIDARLRKTYGEESKLVPDEDQASALAIVSGSLGQRGGGRIRLVHVFVDMTSAWA
jgi:hypothetical protein